MTYSQFEDVSLRPPVDGMAYCDPKQHPLRTLFPSHDSMSDTPVRASPYFSRLSLTPFDRPAVCLANRVPPCHHRYRAAIRCSTHLNADTSAPRSSNSFTTFSFRNRTPGLAYRPQHPTASTGPHHAMAHGLPDRMYTRPHHSNPNNQPRHHTVNATQDVTTPDVMV